MNGEAIVENQDLDLLLQQGEDAAEGTTAPEDGAVPTTPAPTAASNVIKTDGFIYSVDADTEEYKRSYAMNFTVRKKPKSLFVMTLGMPEFHGILDRPPLSVVKRKELNEAYVPKADDLKHEVKRRAHFFMAVEEEATYFTEELKRNHPLKTRRNKIVLPQPNQWLNTNLKKWLADRPMKPNDLDMEFLRSEVNKSLAYLTNESLVETGEATMPAPETPKMTPMPVLAVPLATPTMTSTLSLPNLITEPYSYTSVADTDEFKRSSALTYTKMESKPRVVIAMALGMIEYQGLLDRPPFSLARRKDLTDDFMPRADDYRYEIKRRAHFFMNSEEETLYFTRDLKKKNPLENMRGVVSYPQPNQWKIQALRGWLSERPLKPNKEDSIFIRESIQKIVDGLVGVLNREKLRSDVSSVKKLGTKMPWGTAGATGPGSASAMDKEELLFECISKQEAILGAVAKQNKQQSLLNRITVLNQGITSSQQEISSMRTTINDLENRILNVEMKIAEIPDAEEKLRALADKQSESKEEIEEKIKEIQAKIDEDRKKISELAAEMDDLADEEEVVESNRKRKHEETEQTDGVEI